ncbi:MAG: Flp family type IVb pilin [Vibrio sp.]
MNNFLQLTKDFINDEEGLTIVEYVLGAAAIVAAGAGIFETFFDGMEDAVDEIVKDLKGSESGGGWGGKN